MVNEIYRKLAMHLDQQPGGYPATEDGVELRILQRLFTLQQAELALHLNLIAEPAAVVARRAGMDVDLTENMLAEMAGQGLIMDLHSPGKPAQYMIYQFVVGIWEFQVNRLNLDLIRDVDAYLDRGLFNPEAWKAVPQLRTIPVGKSIPNTAAVSSYEQAEKILDMHDKFAVADCICRKEKGMTAGIAGGESCGKPLETCLVLGDGSDHYIRHGLGRLITKEEALEILKTADREGLVLQADNTRTAGNICCCCGDCCGVLRSVKRHPHPAELISSPFRAIVDADLCAGCGVCLERCQMDAITIEETASIRLTHCIGCGLCVSTCPTGAIQLVRKPAAEQTAIPHTIQEKLLRMGFHRGVLNIPSLLGMVVRSKFDRLLALRK